MAEQDTPPPTITTMKIPIIKKGKYDIWSMRIRQYICHTDHNLWDIIVNRDLQEEPTPTGDQSGPSAPPVPKTAKQLAAKRNQEKVKSILLLAVPDEYLLKFHNVPDAKSFWAAIKSRFGGNKESKKMQKNVLKHHFENFTTAPNESLDKDYDRFKKLINQLEVYAAPVLKEDINQKFLRSIPPSWSQIALIMRNKPDIDQTDIDDLYNNLRVYEDEMKRSLSSTSNSQNLSFLSSENTSSTNEVSPTSGNFGVNNAGGTSSSSQVSSTPGADEVVCSFFAQQTTSPPLDNEDLQQIDQDDLEELDIRWQVAMLTIKVQKLSATTVTRKGHFTKECKSGRNQGKRSYGDNGRRNATTNKPSSQALVAQDGIGGYDWSNDFDEPVNYALMAISSSSSLSFSDNEIPWANLLEKSDEDQPNVAGSGPDWMFDLDFLTNRMNYIPVSVENQVNVDVGTQEHYVAGLSENDKEPTQEYILLPLHPHRPRISVEDVVQAAQEKTFENSLKDNDVQDSEDVAKIEEQHTLTEAEQAFKEEKKRAAQATSINKLYTGRPSVSTSNSPLVSTANTPYASAASTPTGENTGGSSFVYLGGQIPITASTLPNADLPIDPNMLDLEDDSNVFPNDGIFSRAYDDEDVGDPKSAVQTRGKIQKAALVQQALMISQALEDESWVEAMQEELLQFKLQKVWILVDLPFGKKDSYDRLDSTVCERQENWICVLMRLIDDLLALDSIVHFGSSNQRLELIATFSISTNPE
ncbi:hypothetical protein Tco_0932721 [Tanacetum coccineum]